MINPDGYGSIPINTIFRGMNIHLPAILMFTRGTRFWHTAIYIYNPGSFAPNIKTFQKRSPGGFVHFGVWGPGKPLSKLGGLQTPNNELTASCAKGSLNPNWMEREREKGLVVYCVCQSSNNRQWSLQEGFQRYCGAWYISVIFQTIHIRRGRLLKDSSFGRIFLSHSWADLSRFEGTTSPCHSYIPQIWHRPCRMGLWILSHPLSRRRFFSGGVLIHNDPCWLVLIQTNNLRP